MNYNYPQYIVKSNTEIYKDYTSKFVARLLTVFNTAGDQLISNEESKKHIESIILDEFDLAFSNNKNKFIVKGVNMELLSNSLKKYILEKEPSIIHYIKKLYLSQTKSIPSYFDYKGSKNDKYNTCIMRIIYRYIKYIY
jgi:hypothetical protein